MTIQALPGTLHTPCRTPYAVQGYYLKVTPTSLAYSTQFAVQLTGYTSVISQDDSLGEPDEVVLLPDQIPLLIQWLQEAYDEARAEGTHDSS